MMDESIMTRKTEADIANLEQQISDEREKLSSDRMDVSFGELINMYKAKELIIRPEYQRLFRWTVTQKTDLIESILLGIPVPPVFVAEDNDGIWELVDGLQRVSTIISFFGDLRKDLSDDNTAAEEENADEPKIIAQNKWTLVSGSLVPELEGFNYDTLPKKYLLNIRRAVCRVEILRGKSSTEMKYELFKRLNSGGSILTPQEIRNAIYRGINPQINILLEELSKDTAFTTLVKLSEGKKQEQYDQELVLRFIAFYNNIDKINANLETFLDTFMSKAVKDTSFDENQYKCLFTTTLNLLLQAGFDSSVFKNDRNFFVPAYYDGIMIGIAQNLEKYKASPEMISAHIDALKADADFKKYSGSASNSRSRVKKRLERASEIFAQ